MTLPDSFTFTRVDTCDIVPECDKYYATQIGSDVYKVCWRESKGDRSWTYDKDEVLRFINEGYWKIIEQPKENIVKNLFDEFSFTRENSAKLKMRKIDKDGYVCVGQDEDYSSYNRCCWSTESVIRESKKWKDIKEIKAEPVKCNGVDAEGNPLNFTEKDLKVFQRMEFANGCVFIVVHGSYEEELVGVGKDGRGINSWMPFGVEDCDDWNTVAVYSKKEFQNDVLDASTKGKLIWMSNNHPDIVKADTAKAVKLAEIKEALTKLEAERDKLASELGE